LNRGFSGGNNDGIKYAIRRYNPDYFYLLNNDTFVEKNWLEEVIKTASKEKSIGIVGSKQLTFDKKPSISAGWIKTFGIKYYFGENEKEVNWVSGAGFLIIKKVFQKIGLFDEFYNPVYYEETDLEKRAINKRFKIITCPKSIFLHKGGASTPNNFNKYFYINRARYFSKNLKRGLILRFFIDIYRTRKKD